MNLYHWMVRVLIVIFVAGICTTTGGTTTFAASAKPVSVAGGGAHGIAAWSDGTVTGWGYNKYGQVGDGTSIDQYIPKPVAGLTDIIQVAASGDASFALNREGEVWAWGENYSSNVSNDPILPYKKIGPPVKLEGLKEVSYLAPAFRGYAGVAIHKDGTATLWYSSYEAPDYTKNTVKYVPLKGITNARTGIIVNDDVLFLSPDGSVNLISIYNNSYGRYRSGDDPIVVKSLNSSPISRIVGSYGDAFLLRKDGTVLRWNKDSQQPAVIKGLTGIYDLQTGSKHLYLLKQNGTVWQWNYNGGPMARPYQIKGLAGITTLWGSTGQMGFALHKNGELLAWSEGYNAGLVTGSGSPAANDAIVANIQQPLFWTVNGRSVRFYGTSAIIGGELYVPYTSVFEALGIKITLGQSNPDPKYYNNRFPVWTLLYGGNTLIIKASSPAEVFVNGKRSDQGITIRSLSDTTMFPLEAIQEILGFELQWNKTTGEVVLDSTEMQGVE